METLEDLGKAYEGSFYTIAGAGGDLQEWVDGYEKELEEAGIGKPVEWFTTNGAAVNLFAVERGRSTLSNVAPRDRFKSDLGFLLFPLDGLDAGKLAIFKMAWQDRWFDDIIDNMVR